jgi:anaerobic selenocysteine-containing dehydrogenase
LARRADQWLQVRPGTDQVLALGLAHLLIERGAFARAFAAEWTNGPFLVRSDTGRFLRQTDLDASGSPHVLYARDERGRLLAYDSSRGIWLEPAAEPKLRAHLDVATRDGVISCRSAFEIYAAAAAEHPPSRVAKITGVSQTALENAAQIISAASSVAYYAWNGVGQSVMATQTDRAISLFYALTGSYGSRGGNVPQAEGRFADISGKNLLAREQQKRRSASRSVRLGPVCPDGLPRAMCTTRCSTDSRIPSACLFHLAPI